MQTSYIYSVSRLNTLGQFLLNQTDIERLLVATPGEDLQSALKETYLAPYIAHSPEEDVALAIEQTLIDAKRLIHRIAPEHGDRFRILWVHYDIHNLRVFAKAHADNRSYAACVPLLSERGIYDPAYLFSHVEAGTLDRLQSGWGEAFAKASQHAQNGEIDAIDGVFDAAYFATSFAILARDGDAFTRRYFARVVDLYNVKSRLRHAQNPRVSFTPTFIEGGSFGRDRFETREAALALLAQFGGAEFWADAIEHYETTGNTTRLDARADDHLVMLTKDASVDVFSSASLVLYYLKCRQAAANIRTIVVGKNSGMYEADIRANLRLVYVNE
jgi:V/A-type H+-transporting ATPase subunit C